jgi:hypothetical protein
MAKPEKRNRARELRAEGWSVRRIAIELGVAKSSVSVWVRDIPCERPERPRRPRPRRIRPRPEEEAVEVCTRWCPRCAQDLPATAFNWSQGSGYQGWCRDCFREYFRARGDFHRRQVARTQAIRSKRAQSIVLDALRASPCVDCGEQDLLVLEFDHLGDKVAGVATLLAAKGRVDALVEEIKKCEVVCVNCHRRRTARRAGWRRADSDRRSRLDGLTPSVQRNLAFVYRTLEANGCTDCREHDIVVLDFDHLGPKRSPVPYLAWQGASLRRVIAEVRQCEVRCANCHRRRTLAVGGSYRLAAAA